MSLIKYKILLIEINKSDAELAKTEIKKQCVNSEFHEIRSKSELLSALSVFKPSVIVLDPGISDIYELISEIAYFNDAGISVIAFTSSKNEKQAYEFLDNGAWDYIPKEEYRRLAYSVKNAVEHFHAKKEMFYARRDIEEFESYIKKFRDWEAHIPAIVCTFTLKSDGVLHFTYISSASRQYLGCPPEDIVKDSSALTTLINSEDFEIIGRVIKESANKLVPFDKEIRITVEGNTRWFRFFSSPERNSNNEIVWSGILVDVTEQKSMETALSSEHYFMRVLLDNSPDAIYFKDLESRFLAVNKAYLNKVSFKSDKEIIGKTDFDLFVFDHAQNARNDELEIIKTGKSITDKLEKETLADGKISWVSTTKLPLRNKEGNITGTFGISRDITERKNAENMLDYERNMLRILIDALPDLIYVKDKEEKFIINNKAHVEFLGKESFDEICGRKNSEIMDSATAEKFHNEDQIVLTGTPIYNHEVIMDAESGKQRCLLSTKLPLRNAEDEIIGLVGITHDATESKIIQEQIRKSEEKLRYIVNSTSSILFNLVISNDTPRIIWIGDNVKDILGYTPEEIMEPEWWNESIHPDDKKLIENKLPALYKEKRLNLEFRIKHIEKHYVWVNTNFNYSDDASDVVIHGVFGSWIDITERMMAQEALLKSKEQLSYALKIAKLAYWEYDVQEDLFILNDQFYSVMGTNVPEQKGYTLSSSYFIDKFIHSDDAFEISDAINLAANSGIEVNKQFEFKNIFKDGSTHYYLLFIFNSPGSNGEAIKVNGIIQDVSERKKSIDAILDSEKKLSNALKMANLAYWEYDVINDRFTFNDQFFALLKTNAADEGGYTMSSEQYAKRFVHPEDLHMVGNEVTKTNEAEDSGFNSYLEHRIIYPDGGTGYIAVRYFVVKDKSGKTIKTFGANQDITDRVKREMEKLELEKELLLRNKELETMLDDMTRMQKTLVHTEKMASLGELSAGIAHEINNPLSYVCSNINRLKEYFDDTVSLLKKWEAIEPHLTSAGLLTELITSIDEYSKKIDMEFILEDFDRMMHSIQDGTQRIKKIVEGMRGFAHISENSMQNADINQAIEETLTIVWNELKYKAEIKKEYGVLPPVKCNISEIKQVLVNLLVNAAHAINEKGIIKIITSTVEDDLYIKIIDNGCGIPEDKLKRIFDPFFTTKPVGKGTGLGLWISSTIIEKHKGSITVDSEQDYGSTFTVKLPINNNY
jgi:PAS domain S-box-containing protein